MSNTNPFKELGLDSALVESLSGEQLDLLIKAQFRTLQMIYHPDRGGNERKSREITEAYELIGPDRDQELFHELKKDFLKQRPTAKRVRELESMLTISQQLLVQRSDQILDYFKALYGCYDIPIEEIEASRADESPKSKVRQHTYTDIFSTPFEVLVRDYANSVNREPYTQDLRGRAEDISTLFVGVNGDVFVKNGKKKKKIDGKRIVGAVKPSAVKSPSSMTKLLRDAIGDFLPVELIEGKYGRSVGKLTLNYFDNRINEEEFKTLVRYVSPWILSGSYIVGMNVQEDNEPPYFSIDGQVIKVSGRTFTR